MYTTSIFDQTNRSGTLARYDGANEYLSDSSSCTDNRSDLGSDDYNDYGSNYELNNEEAPHNSTSTVQTTLVQSSNVKKQKINVAYTLRQEKFNDNFSSKDLLNAIREISYHHLEICQMKRGHWNISQSIHFSFQMKRV